MRDESSTPPLVMFGDPTAAVCDGDVCSLPSSDTSSSATPSSAGPAEAERDGDDAERPQ